MVCKRTPAVAAAADLEKAGVAVVVATVAPGTVTGTKATTAVDLIGRQTASTASHNHATGTWGTALYAD